jgi:hypothetical protein
MLLLLASTYKRISCLAVVAVTLWLGGFGCSLCCATGAADSCCLDGHQSPARATARTAGATSCDAGAACSCCQSRRAERQSAQTDEAIGREGALGCSLLPNRLEGVTVHLTATDALVAQAELPTRLFVADGLARTTSLLDTPPPLNRGGTYLRCGVLLI